MNTMARSDARLAVAVSLAGLAFIGIAASARLATAGDSSLPSTGTTQATNADTSTIGRSVRAIRRQHAVQAFNDVAAYVTTRPDAPDAVEGYRFLFETATDFDLARGAKPLAEQFLVTYPDASSTDRSHARGIAMQALALEGEADAAIELFGEELVALRRLAPDPAIVSATKLAAAVQRGERPEAVRDVYERLQRAFLLNPRVEALAVSRLARFERLGKPVPMTELVDLDGKPADFSALAGKTILVDFWATNCPPCLEELPELRQLYADYEECGFTILAISLDEEEAEVRRFLDRTPLPWRQLLSASDGDATRNAFGVETIPANFLIGADGTVQRVDLHGADLRAEVERMVAEQK